MANKKIIFGCFISSLLLFFINFTSTSLVCKTIHIIGDSHASFCFRENAFLQKKEQFVLPVTIDKKKLTIPFVIHWLGPITMHRVGRDGLNFLNLKDFNVQKDDVVVFVFGEIDVRCHIGKQRDNKKRELEEIIDNLAVKYITAIQENQKQFEQLACVVCCITPPLDGIGRNNPEYPFYGELSDRIAIARNLNKKLQALCASNGILFLDFYDLYCDAQGALSLKYADPTVHIDYVYNQAIKKKLIELIAHL